MSGNPGGKPMATDGDPRLPVGCWRPLFAGLEVQEGSSETLVLAACPRMAPGTADRAACRTPINKRQRVIERRPTEATGQQRERCTDSDQDQPEALATNRSQPEGSASSKTNRTTA